MSRNRIGIWGAVSLVSASFYTACGSDDSSGGAKPDAGHDAGAGGKAGAAGSAGTAGDGGGVGGTSGTGGSSGSDAGPNCTPLDQVPKPPANDVSALSSCPAITPCVGPLESQKWRYHKVCLDEDVVFSSMYEACSSAQFNGIGDVEVSGSLELAGGNVTHKYDIKATGVFQAPITCASCDCKGFQQVLIQQYGAGFNTYCYPECYPDNSCRCLVDVELKLDETTTYTLTGSSFTTGSGKTYDSCASATALALAEKTATASFPGTAELLPASDYKTPEICDGVDNDENGKIDDAPIDCPATPCLTQGVCVGSKSVCTPGWTCDYGSAPTEFPDETSCDGLDNDCDGQVDDGLVGCVEICDGLDNDNNGKIDDNPQGAHCPTALGVCTSGVVPKCLGTAGWQCDYTSPAHQLVESLCDGLDNDCNGLKDEGCKCSTGKSKVYVESWGGSPSLIRADLDGQNKETIAPLSGMAFTRISIDAEHEKIYYFDGKTLRRANLDGSAIEPIWTGDAQMLEVDPGAGRIYAECGTYDICTASYAPPVATSKLLQGPAVAWMDIDLVNRYVYWSDHGSAYEKNMVRVDLDGTDVTPLFKLPGAPLTIAVSQAVNKMYWGTNMGISEAGFDGKNEKVTVSAPSSYTHDMVIDGRGKKIYFTDVNANEVRRADLDGTGAYEPILTSVPYPFAIALYICSP